MVEAADYFSIGEWLVLFNILRRSRREASRRVERSCNRVAVFHAEPVKNVLQVVLLRKMNGAELAVAMYLHSKMFGGMFIMPQRSSRVFLSSETSLETTSPSSTSMCMCTKDLPTHREYNESSTSVE